MKKIYFNSLCGIVLCLGGISVFKMFSDENDQEWLFLFVIACVLAIVVSFYKWSQEEKDDPLNYNKQLAALKFACAKQTGKKSEFLSNHGKELYDFFIQLGIIHELLANRCDDDPVWEITQKGEMKSKTF